MWWFKIIEWFSNTKERRRFLSEFNDTSKKSFISNLVPVYLKSEISIGNRNYKHSMSNFFFSGFRIKALSGRQMSRTEVIELGNFMSSNQELMRKLVTLGFDTLEICDMDGYKINDWRLIEMIQIEQK